MAFIPTTSDDVMTKLEWMALASLFIYQFQRGKVVLIKLFNRIKPWLQAWPQRKKIAVVISDVAFDYPSLHSIIYKDMKWYHHLLPYVIIMPLDLAKLSQMEPDLLEKLADERQRVLSQLTWWGGRRPVIWWFMANGLKSREIKMDVGLIQLKSWLDWLYLQILSQVPQTNADINRWGLCFLQELSQLADKIDWLNQRLGSQLPIVQVLAPSSWPESISERMVFLPWRQKINTIVYQVCCSLPVLLLLLLSNQLFSEYRIQSAYLSHYREGQPQPNTRWLSLNQQQLDEKIQQVKQTHLLNNCVEPLYRSLSYVLTHQPSFRWWKLASRLQAGQVFDPMKAEIMSLFKQQGVRFDASLINAYLNHLEAINKIKPLKLNKPSIKANQKNSIYAEYLRRYKLSFDASSWSILHATLCPLNDRYLLVKPDYLRQLFNPERLSLYLRQTFLNQWQHKLSQVPPHTHAQDWVQWRRHMRHLNLEKHEQYYRYYLQVKWAKRVSMKQFCQQHRPDPAVKLADIFATIPLDFADYTPKQRKTFLQNPHNPLLIALKKLHHLPRTVQPLQDVLRDAWSLLLKDFVNDLNRQWQVKYRIYLEFKTKFPFDLHAEADISIADLKQFLRDLPHAVSVPVVNHQQVKMKSLKSWRALATLFGREPLEIKYQLYPHPNPNYKEIIFYQGHAYRYRNEPQRWQSRYWRANDKFCFIKARALIKDDRYLETRGVFAFWRLITLAKRKRIDRHRYRLNWRDVCLDIKFDRHHDFIDMLFARQLELPRKLFTLEWQAS